MFGVSLAHTNEGQADTAGRGKIPCMADGPVTRSCFPFGLNATPSAYWVCALYGAPIGRNVATSHTRTVWSSALEAMRAPPGPNSTSVTGELLRHVLEHFRIMSVGDSH